MTNLSLSDVRVASPSFGPKSLVSGRHAARRTKQATRGLVPRSSCTASLFAAQEGSRECSTPPFGKVDRQRLPTKRDTTLLGRPWVMTPVKPPEIFGGHCTKIWLPRSLGVDFSWP